MPSVQDERDTYTAWGWSWTASNEPSAVTERISNYYVTGVEVHGDAEGDDLWTYLMMYKRSGNAVYLNRAVAWARYFKDEYRLSPEFDYDRGFLMDHLFGWGLLDWYAYTCDTSTCDSAALTEAENLAAEVETYWNQRNSSGQPRFVAGQYHMATYGIRQGARHLLLATRVAEVTGKQRWKDLRDKLIDLWLQSPDWDSRGIYYMVDDPAYNKGVHLAPAFHLSVLTEAFDQAYRTTGRTALRDRLVSIARFIEQYGLDPTYQYSGSRFGVDANGNPWHNYSDTASVTYWDPVYTTALVNPLMRGYKYTGERHFYDRAKYHLNRGTKGIYGEPIQRAAADNVVHHFVDTKFASSTGFFYLDYNKGELQYTYMVFDPALRPAGPYP